MNVVLWSRSGEPTFPGVACVSLLASGRRIRLLRLFAVIWPAVKLLRRLCRLIHRHQQVTVAITLSVISKLIWMRV